MIDSKDGMEICSSMLDPFAEFTVPTTPCLHFEDGWFGWRDRGGTYGFRCNLIIDGVTDKDLLRDNLYLFKSKDSGLRNAILNNKDGIRNTVPNDKIRELAEGDGEFNHNGVNVKVLTMEKWMMGTGGIDNFLDGSDIEEMDVPNIGERGLKLLLDDRFESDYYYGFVYIDADTNVRSFSDVFYRDRDGQISSKPKYNDNFIGDNKIICNYRWAEFNSKPEEPYYWNYYVSGSLTRNVVVFDNGFKLF